MLPGDASQPEPGSEADPGDAQDERRGKRDRQRLRDPEALHQPVLLRGCADREHPEEKRAVREDARSVVARLLSQAPQRMELAQVAEVVRAELGRYPDELFAHFEREPLAAASLGQVHAARLLDGREVVVKVQYPGVEKALQNDLANAAVLVRGFALAGDALDGRPYYDELR